MKKILSCDGGGIGALFSLQVLARIEELYRIHEARPGLVLREVFDFFAGTSTGAIIAAGLAWGMSVREIEQIYLDRSQEIFTPAPWHRRLRGTYSRDPIARVLQECFCEEDQARTPALLGTRRLWAGDALKYLLIVMRNASTGSPWPVSNNPCARYNHPGLPDCNLHIPLWKLLRASTAAPVYFPPEEIHLGGRSHLFIDGGVTPYNNPALIAVLTATLPAYGIEWHSGPDHLLLVSVGTGFERTTFKKQRVADIHLLDHAWHVPAALVGSIALQQDMLCRILGECRFGEDIDSELGKLAPSGLLSSAEKKFSYVRYNRLFDRAETSELARKTGGEFTLDNIRLIPHLCDEGRDYAASAVSPGDIGLVPDSAASFS